MNSTFSCVIWLGQIFILHISSLKQFLALKNLKLEGLVQDDLDYTVYTPPSWHEESTGIDVILHKMSKLRYKIIHDMQVHRRQPITVLHRVRLFSPGYDVHVRYLHHIAHSPRFPCRRCLTGTFGCTINDLDWDEMRRYANL